MPSGRSCEGDVVLPIYAGLVASNLRLAYPLPDGNQLDVLDIPELRIPRGDTVGLTGPSGSGKTSLLYVLAGLEHPQQGTVAWAGIDVVRLPEGARDKWRRRSVGFVFQDFHLFSGMSLVQNVLVPTSFEQFRPLISVRARAESLLSRVGIERKNVTPDRCSRGEMQRVAVARALLFSPPVVMADEPTASLDPANGQAVSDLLIEMCRETESTLVVVTHDRVLLDRLSTVRTLIRGRLQ
jgi:putative ABC transport system ATP-binding protein